MKALIVSLTCFLGFCFASTGFSKLPPQCTEKGVQLCIVTSFPSESPPSGQGYSIQYKYNGKSVVGWLCDSGASPIVLALHSGELELFVANKTFKQGRNTVSVNQRTHGNPVWGTCVPNPWYSSCPVAFNIIKKSDGTYAVDPPAIIEFKARSVSSKGAPQMGAPCKL